MGAGEFHWAGTVAMAGRIRKGGGRTDDSARRRTTILLGNFGQSAAALQTESAFVRELPERPLQVVTAAVEP